MRWCGGVEVVLCVVVLCVVMLCVVVLCDVAVVLLVSCCSC